MWHGILIYVWLLTNLNSHNLCQRSLETIALKIVSTTHRDAGSQIILYTVCTAKLRKHCYCCLYLLVCAPVRSCQHASAWLKSSWTWYLIFVTSTYKSDLRSWPLSAEARKVFIVLTWSFSTPKQSEQRVLREYQTVL